jgi:hypothetical protein
MVVKKKNSTYKPKGREELSNPHRNCSHDNLLNKSKVKSYNGNFEVKTLNNGRIVLKSAKK